MRFPFLSALLLATVASTAASAAPSFTEICLSTKDPAVRNTIEIMMAAVKLLPAPSLSSCVQAQARLEKL